MEQPHPSHSVVLFVSLASLASCHSRMPATIQVVDQQSGAPLAGAEVRYVFPQILEPFAPKGGEGMTDTHGIANANLAKRSTHIYVTRPNYARTTIVLDWANGHFMEFQPSEDGKALLDISQDQERVHVGIRLQRKPIPDTIVMLPSTFTGLLLICREPGASVSTRWEGVRHGRRHNERVFRIPPGSDLLLTDLEGRPVAMWIDAHRIEGWESEELWCVGSGERAHQIRSQFLERVSDRENRFDHAKYLRVRESILSGGTGMEPLGLTPNPRRN